MHAGPTPTLYSYMILIAQPVGVEGKIQLYYMDYLGIQWYKPDNLTERHCWSLTLGKIKKQEQRYVNSIITYL